MSVSELEIHIDSVSEWLRSMIRNHLGSARAGSNPVTVDLLKECRAT
jgi:hypothetical protein